MTPEQLCKSNSEHGHQRALFAWANMAEQFGFALAWDERLYGSGAIQQFLPGGCNRHIADPVPELSLFHAIPNGGLRDKRTAAMLKAEGVKRGIPDTFLPLPCWGIVAPGGVMNPPERRILYAGLYVEMKRPKSEERGRAGVTSDDQDEVIGELRRRGYAVSVCFSWDAAAREVEAYVKAVRAGAA
jgi:hypothetical protein